MPRYNRKPMRPPERPTNMRRSIGMAALALLVACGGGSDVHPTIPSVPALDDLQGTWQLESGTVAGVAFEPVAGHPVTLIVEPGSVGGSAGCNSYGGRLVVGPALSILEMASTAMACEPSDVMDVEMTYTRGLMNVETMARQGDKLTLSGPDVDLLFRQVADVDPAAFADIEWRLVALGAEEGGEAPAGEVPTLVLTSDGRLIATTGCRDLDGAWTTSGPDVLVTRMAASGECPADLVIQDSMIISVLGDGFRPSIVDGDLILTSMGDEALRYRR